MRKITFFCMLLANFSAYSCELVIKTVSSSDWPPYFFKSDGNEAGLEVDILITILGKTPFCLEFVELPSLSRAFEELKYKRVDLLVASSFHQDRESFAQFSKPYRKEKVVIFESKKNRNMLQSLINRPNYLEYINLKNTFIAVHRGSLYGDNFNQFLKSFKGNTVSTTLAKQRFDLLKKGRVDYAIEDELTGISLLADSNYSDHIANTKIAVFNEAVYYMLRHGLMSDEQLDLFNQAIEDSYAQIEDIIKLYSTQVDE